MKVNWKVRFKNPVFVITVAIPGVLILVQMILAFINTYVTPIGYHLTDEAINGFMGIVNFFAITFLGIGGIIDPTVKNLGDSQRVMDRNKPL